MPAYQNKKTKKWYFRTYADDPFGNRKQYERSGFETKKLALEAESIFKLDNKEVKTDTTFQELYRIQRISFKITIYESVKK